MSGKATVVAPANLAFVKYWGAVDLERALPRNPSISMTLSECHSRSTVEPCPGAATDEILLRGEDGTLSPAPPAFAERVLAHLERLRRSLGSSDRFRVATENSFPAAAGMASSASGFAALTLAVARALGRDLGEREASALARSSGSGSAARSVIGGYVEWPAGESEDDCYAFPLASHEHWDLRNVVAIVDAGPKRVSSRDGHRLAETSPYFEGRQQALPRRLRAVRDAIAARDLGALGPVLEEDAIDLHLIAMSSRPPIFYWKPGTLAVLEVVRGLRDHGLSCWSTMDAGPNVHVICEPGEEARVAASLEALDGVTRIIRDRVGPGPQDSDRHLF